MDEYCDEQARQIAAVLVKSRLLEKDREMAAVGLLRESLRERFSREKIDEKIVGCTPYSVDVA